MDIFLTVVVLLVAHVEVGSTLKLNRKISLQSLYRRKNSCSGGNLLKIHTHRCTNGLCNVTLDGSSTTMTKTKFRIINITDAGKKCIEFQNKYVLKVVSGTNVAFKFQKLGCHDSISNKFQFEEHKTPKYRVYKYNNNGNIMCLGVKKGCNDPTLYLINGTQGNRHDRRCYFDKP